MESEINNFDNFTTIQETISATKNLILLILLYSQKLEIPECIKDDIQYLKSLLKSLFDKTIFDIALTENEIKQKKELLLIWITKLKSKLRIFPKDDVEIAINLFETLPIASLNHCFCMRRWGDNCYGCEFGRYYGICGEKTSCITLIKNIRQNIVKNLKRVKIKR